MSAGTAFDFVEVLSSKVDGVNKYVQVTNCVVCNYSVYRLVAQ